MRCKIELLCVGKIFVRFSCCAAQKIYNILRDVSLQPENLMVDVMNSSSRVRLIDFGDARNITNGYYVHPLVGSPEFASPELVNGSPVDLSADIW